MARSHTITGWDPENGAAWEGGGQAVARRNLLWSVAVEHVGFSVWSLRQPGIRRSGSPARSGRHGV